MKRIWIVLRVCALGALMLMQSGCIAVAAAGGAGAAYVFDRGAVEKQFRANVERTMTATRQAMADLKLEVLSAEHSTLEGEVVARVGNDNKAEIKVVADGSEISRVLVRIGTWGDEGMSKAILDRIESRLANPARAVAAVP